MLNIGRVERKAEFTSTLPLLSLFLYVCVLRPSIHLFLPGFRIYLEEISILYFAIGIGLLMSRYPLGLRDMGFSTQYFGRHFTLGGVLSLVLIGCLPLLDIFIDVSGLANGPLFSGAQSRVLEEAPEPLGIYPITKNILLFPIIIQTYFLILILSPLAKKISPIWAIYSGGIIFPLLVWKSSLGMALAGMISSALFYLTQTLWASLIFNSAFVTAGLLLAYSFPRVVTLLAFLF